MELPCRVELREGLGLGESNAESEAIDSSAHVFMMAEEDRQKKD